jgi:hypothetical protein
MLEYCCISLKRMHLVFTRCKEYLNIREGGWEKTYRSCQTHESLLLYDVVSPFYNKPDVKFSHISNYTETLWEKQAKKKKMPFSTSIFNWSTPVTAHKQGTIAVPQRKPLPRSSAKAIFSICINFKLPSSWEVIGI